MSEEKDDIEENREILEEACERFEQVLGVDKDNRDNQTKDTLFVFSPGNQWPDDVKSQRNAWKELCLEFNQLKQFVAQVVNDQRQNRPGVRVHPADGSASKETADILQGMIRGIEYDSRAEAAYDNGFQGAVVGGRGYWRICSEYVDGQGFEQKLVILPIYDPNTVYADIDYQQPDGSDRSFAFVTETITRKEFKRKWPDADPVDWEKIDRHWTNGTDDIVIADYYRRICTMRTMVLMSDGASGYKDEMPEPPEGITEVRSRECEVWSVEWYKIAGGFQILEKYDWPGTVIPIVCTTGDDIMLDGKRVYQGLTRHARDAQSMLNFGMTQQAIHLSLTPRAPWVAAEGQLEGYEDIWKDANVKNYSVLPYKPTSIDGTPVPPPQRTAPSMPDAGWGNWCEMMINMIRSTIGMYQNSLGQHGVETSGRAIIARQKQGDNSTFNYVDNLSRAIALTGRIIVECIPHYYDTQRIVHTIGIDDSRNAVTINQTAPNPDDPLTAIKNNDTTTGKYSVTVESGPSYATKRQETAEALSGLAQTYPPLMQLAGDIVIRAQDIPDADAIADRLKLALPPQILQAEQSKQQGGKAPDPQVMAAMQQKDQQLKQAVDTMHAMDAKVKELESGAQQELQKAQMSADLEIQKEHIYTDRDLKKATIDRDRAIQVALINQETQIKTATISSGMKVAEIEKQAEMDIQTQLALGQSSLDGQQVELQPTDGVIGTP